TVDTRRAAWRNVRVSSAPRSGPVAAVAYRLRHDLAADWRRWLAIGLIAGVGAGLVLACLNGADRTDTAVPRLQQAMRLGDIYYVIGNVPEQSAMLTAASRLPQVVAAGRERNYQISGTAPNGAPIGFGEDQVAASMYGATDDRNGRVEDIPVILHGRRVRP